MPDNNRRQEIVIFLKTLRESIISAFESIEPTLRFGRTSWNHHSGGGGEMSVLRGKVFEKAAVNWSGVEGEKYPFSDGEGSFFATGVSLITHMTNPHAPTVHMNVRYIETARKHWFGGGYDLTPMGFPYQEDTEHFHTVAKTAIPHLYAKFAQNAKEYFYIPHRKKERGVGGIFFDHYRTDNFSEDLQFWKNVGTSFVDAIMPIYKRRIHQSYTEQDRDLQLKMRAHYAEFNLLYDRGTKFGFQSGGNPEAILCSMPPLLKW